VPLEDATYTSKTTYDAMNRLTTATAPDGSVSIYKHNHTNQVKQIFNHLRGTEYSSSFVQNIEYNAKGQRTLVEYGNGAKSVYKYDHQTFRLLSIVTRRSRQTFPRDSHPEESWPGSQIQNLHYTYDPIGNIISIRDDAQQRIFFRNKRVDPSQDYTYDATYRLIQTEGREHLGQLRDPTTTLHGRQDGLHHFVTRSNHSNDKMCMGSYRESYEYDSAGNLLSMRHHNAASSEGSWTRHYEYNERSQLESLDVNNRLSHTRIGSIRESYLYDGDMGVHGNITAMPRLRMMSWDFKDQLKASSKQLANDGIVPETTWYTYDAAGKRVRKVTEKAYHSESQPTRLKETLYLSGMYNIFRTYSSANRDVTLQLETINILEQDRRIALIEIRSKGNDSKIPPKLIRYQFSNHQTSVTLELNDQGEIISYEEYTPYGSTSYQAVQSQTEIPKRYRFTGKERDETGLYYHGSRYYASWLGRWVSGDPKGLIDGLNLFVYVRGNPVVYTDPSGTQSKGSGDTPTPQLMGNWSYGTSVPGWFRDMFHNVQRDHPIQVQLRSQQTLGAYSRVFSAAQGELTILAETGKGYFHTEVGTLQRAINAQVRAGIIAHESDLLEATRNGYYAAAKKTGAVVNPQALDRSLVSNLGTLGQLQRLKDTAASLAKLPEVVGQAISAESIERAFTDPAPPLARAGTAIAKTAQAVAAETVAVAEEVGQVAAVTAEEVAANAAPVARLGAGGLAAAAGTQLAYNFIPGAAEVHQFVQMGGLHVVAGYAAQAGKALAAGIEAAPLAAASAVVGGGVVGGVVGHYVGQAMEEATGSKAAGVATAVVSGAASGALVGAAIGSIVPGLGTAVGATLGGVAGAVGGFIGSYF